MRGENWCFQQFLRRFSTPPRIGRRVVGVTVRFQRSDGAASRFAFQTQKKQIRRIFSTAEPEKRERNTNRGLSFAEHTPASSGCLRFLPQIGLSPAAHRCNSYSEHKQTTTTAGEMGREGNSPGGHFLEMRSYNYSNSAGT